QTPPSDCSEIPPGSPSGIYIIQPAGLHRLVVYCEMNVTNGGWTVIQRNKKDTPITWAESWSTYKYGFGNVRSEYWLGTEYIYQIAKQKVYQVKFVIQDATNTTKFADYNLFSLEDESHGYRLRLGSYTGTAGDAMTSNNPNNMHDNMKFSTKDRDQDTYSKNCAYSYEGGWWYSACYSVRLNFKGGMTWGSLCTGNCKSSLILIKPDRQGKGTAHTPGVSPLPSCLPTTASSSVQPGLILAFTSPTTGCVNTSPTQLLVSSYAFGGFLNPAGLLAAPQQ
uniref:Fibrinogen C-terminal domain-containing protein n=1 Tax=Dromaius novaehollandiae TaxID=8790 RepID=A0A8C4KJR6_DRONO